MRHVFPFWKKKKKKRKNNNNCIFDINVDNVPDQNFVVLWHTCVKELALLKCLFNHNYFSEVNLNLCFYYVEKSEMKQFKIIYL